MDTVQRHHTSSYNFHASELYGAWLWVAWMHMVMQLRMNTEHKSEETKEAVWVRVVLSWHAWLPTKCAPSPSLPGQLPPWTDLNLAYEPNLVHDRILSSQNGRVTTSHNHKIGQGEGWGEHRRTGRGLLGQGKVEGGQGGSMVEKGAAKLSSSESIASVEGYFFPYTEVLQSQPAPVIEGQLHLQGGRGKHNFGAVAIMWLQ